ncbi:DNA-binding protein [Clostridium senegalense]|uniref:DNA-binding protein n=1 Tax=Clostridium senegalense TaxID=1465809 RepID=A0A6M0H5W2_9CLOT|nr:DNA-binding protein [Clostridium senegalense]NEU05698.1 DNA-binding protein [Clostridium senegalense]
MNELNNNKPMNNHLNYATNLNINSNNKIANENFKKEINSTINFTNDSIQLDPNRKNIINKINASKAFNEACDDMNLSLKELGHLTIAYGRICSEIQNRGINVPDFNLDNYDQETSSFLPFISKMKEFTQNYFSKDNHFITSVITSDVFLGFCDKFEEKLKKYDCL